MARTEQAGGTDGRGTASLQFEFCSRLLVLQSVLRAFPSGGVAAYSAGDETGLYLVAGQVALERPSSPHFICVKAQQAVARG